MDCKEGGGGQCNQAIIEMKVVVQRIRVGGNDENGRSDVEENEAAPRRGNGMRQLDWVHCLIGRI
jgi:hypothetical protein